MEAEEDIEDFYGDSPKEEPKKESVDQNAEITIPQHLAGGNGNGNGGDGAEDGDDDDEDEYEDDEDEDDIKIITEATPRTIANIQAQAAMRPQRSPHSAGPSALSATFPRSEPRTPASTTTPGPLNRPPTSASSASSNNKTLNNNQNVAREGVSQRPGSSYPAHHTSTIDVDANPVHPETSKPILDTDLDVDFAPEKKRWRIPGSDITDYFNYGFDEFTWASYCLKQREMRKGAEDPKKQMEELQSLLSMPAGIPGMPPPPMGAMPFMPPMPMAPPAVPPPQQQHPHQQPPHMPNQPQPNGMPFPPPGGGMPPGPGHGFPPQAQMGAYGGFDPRAAFNQPNMMRNQGPRRWQ